MEDDRAQTDLGIAADIEEAQHQASSPGNAHTPSALPAEAEAAQTPSQPQENGIKQPKKRFVGRRAATEAAVAKQGDKPSESGAVQREFTIHPSESLLLSLSLMLSAANPLSQAQNRGDLLAC